MTISSDNFIQLTNLKEYTNLVNELANLPAAELTKWQSTDQLCLTSTLGKEDDCQLGCGSLYYDWSTKRYEIDSLGNSKLIVDPYENPISENDFSELCNIFKNTTFFGLFP
jgi:hypothetical protein